MNIAVVGTGYVGLVSGVCFAEMGANVYCIDIDQAKIDNLKKGVLPIYEEGLLEMMNQNVLGERLHFSTVLSECLKDVDIVFIAVGTPSNDDGSADLSYVFDVAKTFGEYVNKYTLLVTKSTVPIGTSNKVKQIVQKELDRRGVNVEFDIASNPEFLKEGVAIKDFMMPDRVVIGVESERAKEIMSSLYRPFLLNNYRVIFMDVLSSEMTKYAANAMLATRISFINEMARLCELTGADVNSVRAGIASDSRIGKKFLYPGCGYGGSCFPKDISALIRTASENGYQMKIIQAVDEVNNVQKEIVYSKILTAFNGDLRGKTIAIWGLSFKPGTDDMREAPSVVAINLLLKAGAKVRVFDPISIKMARSILAETVVYCESMYDAVTGADAVALITEWKQFRMPNWKRIRGLMNDFVFVDGRNIYNPKEVEREGFRYYSIGRL